MGALIETLSFLVTLGLLFFLPGFLVLETFFPKRTVLLAWEKLCLSFGISIGLVDVLMLFLERLGIPSHAFSLGVGMILFAGALAGSAFLYRKWRKAKEDDHVTPSLFHLSPLQSKLFLLLLFLTVFIKGVYLLPLVLPTSTDLGHHMYWSKLIATTGEIPEYREQEIHTDEAGNYFVTPPEPIADFIVGEHLPFAAMSIFSGLDILSAFPVTFLLVVNLLGVIGLVLLAYRLVQDVAPRLFGHFFSGTNVALFALLLFGPLYSLASPQARFVSGGVVGNMFGNFFIPLILLLFFRGLKEKKPALFTLGLFFMFILAYTHHLSTLVLLFTLLGITLVYLVIHHQTLFSVLGDWRKTILRPVPILFMGLALLFLFFVAVPTYLEKSAIDTAIGTPSKNTRTGLSFLQIASSSGDARVALGLLGLVLVLFWKKVRESYAGAILLGWGGMLLIMTMRPDLLFIDIPSNRIGSYLSFPLGILGAWLLGIFSALLLARDKKTAQTALPSALVFLGLLSVLAFSIGHGAYDNGQALATSGDSEAAVQTYAVSEYLAKRVRGEGLILKDHNYVTADAWMKTFFLRDYNYPLSRGLFGRYEDNPDREHCTLYMISVPNTPQGAKCFEETGTRYIVVHPLFDAAQFEKSKNFSRVFFSNVIHVYKR